MRGDKQGLFDKIDWIHPISNTRNIPKCFRVQALFSDSLWCQQPLCSNSDVTYKIRLQGYSLYRDSLYWILRVYASRGVAFSKTFTCFFNGLRVFVPPVNNAINFVEGTYGTTQATLCSNTSKFKVYLTYICAFCIIPWWGYKQGFFDTFSDSNNGLPKHF